MKKNLLLLFAIFTTSLFAQELVNDAVNITKVKHQEITSADKSVVVIWEEDFGSGFEW